MPLAASPSREHRCDGICSALNPKVILIVALANTFGGIITLSSFDRGGFDRLLIL